jgi:hypothetical protein
MKIIKPQKEIKIEDVDRLGHKSARHTQENLYNLLSDELD